MFEMLIYAEIFEHLTFKHPKFYIRADELFSNLEIEHSRSSV